MIHLEAGEFRFSSRLCPSNGLLTWIKGEDEEFFHGNIRRCFSGAWDALTIPSFDWGWLIVCDLMSSVARQHKSIYIYIYTHVNAGIPQNEPSVTLIRRLFDCVYAFDKSFRLALSLKHSFQNLCFKCLIHDIYLIGPVPPIV